MHTVEGVSCLEENRPSRRRLSFSRNDILLPLPPLQRLAEHYHSITAQIHFRVRSITALALNPGLLLHPYLTPPLLQLRKLKANVPRRVANANQMNAVSACASLHLVTRFVYRLTDPSLSLPPLITTLLTR